MDLTKRGGEDGPEPAISLWWLGLAFMAAGLLIWLLAWLLHLALGLPQDLRLVTPAIWLLIIAGIFAKPETFRHLAIAAAVGLAVGVLAMLCYLPLALHAQSFEASSQRFLVGLLGVALVFLPGAWIVLLALRRLAVPLRADSAKGRS